jgi:hypothetical protein
VCNPHCPEAFRIVQRLAPDGVVEVKTEARMKRRELTLIGAGLRTKYEAAKKAPLTPSMLSLLVQLRQDEESEKQALVKRDWSKGAAASAVFPILRQLGPGTKGGGSSTI